jgi:hypothetical protein
MKALRSISAVVLALLVLFSSTSFMVGMHLCMGEVQSIGFFSKADGCKEEQSPPPCHRHTTVPCCDEETIIHQADDFKASMGHYHIAVPPSMESEQPRVLISEVIPTAPLSAVKYFNYDPPLLSCDLTVDHQVFLI